jgi:hypothetical protein
VIRGARSVAIHPLELLDGRHHVEDRRVADAIRVVERESIGDARAPIVPDDIEAIETKHSHHLDQIESHRALGIGRCSASMGGWSLAP